MDIPGFLLLRGSILIICVFFGLFLGIFIGILLAYYFKYRPLPTVIILSMIASAIGTGIVGMIFQLVYEWIVLDSYAEFINGLTPVLFLLMIVGLITIGRRLFYAEFTGSEKAKGQFLAILTIICLIGTIITTLLLYHSYFEAPVKKAEYFNSFINHSTENLFSSEIPDDMIRLVDKNLARTIAKNHMSTFGSNVMIRSIHITTHQGRLVWIAAIGSNNFASQELDGLLLVDANDPTAIPTQIELPSGVYYSEGLFYGKDIQRYAWIKNSWLDYGRSYITWAPENISPSSIQPNQIVQVLTYNIIKPFDWVSYYGGVKVFDLNGNLLETYSELSTMPSWIAQPFDETWLEQNIDNWGNMRRGVGFDRWAGGFMGLTKPSADRLDISLDTRWIISPDTGRTIAITPVHPASTDLTNAGVFLSTSSGITFFDYSNRNYTSTKAVERYVESQEPPAAQGEYQATLPMLYPIKANEETRLVWFIPLYHQYSESNDLGYEEIVQFRGLYIIDATNLNINGKAYLGDYGSTTSMIAAARGAFQQAYLKSIGAVGESFAVVNITEKAIYSLNGETHIAFKTNNSTYNYLIAKPSLLNETEFLYILFEVDVGSELFFKAYELNDVWYITEIQR